MNITLYREMNNEVLTHNNILCSVVLCSASSTLSTVSVHPDSFAGYFVPLSFAGYFIPLSFAW